MPRPSMQDFEDQEIQERLARADQDARELQLDPIPVVAPPDLNQVKKQIAGEPGSRPIFAARDPRLRSELVKKEGGTLLTEAAVARGLRWLAQNQNQDGSWSLSNYQRSDRPDNQGDTAGTALALLPFLGAGQTHEYGMYKENVAQGLRWLIERQAIDGDLRAGLNNVQGMYAHGQATIVLVEALAMTGDE
ncbi:MAG: prenyltransferase/squalene oxidase repeat-containing protein, partial [Planctomycetota bacterium]|nr:prenyltransferase/squalene oxidase repeat-containing protein [Planctomycetota bacterium]